LSWEWRCSSRRDREALVPGVVDDPLLPGVERGPTSLRSAKDLPTVSLQSVLAWSVNGGHGRCASTVALISANSWFTGCLP
jgi:hypothetical protein